MSSTEMAAWPPPIASGGKRKLPTSALLLFDGESAPAAGEHRNQPSLLQNLREADRREILARGTKRVLHRGATLFRQGAQHDGIYLIESGRIRVFYSAPSGREVTLAYWYPGNFVGGPGVFGDGVHQWSGTAACASSVLHINGTTLRELILRHPPLAIGIIEGLEFKGRCYSAMAQILGTRSVTERLAHLLLHLADLYGMEEGKGQIVIDTNFTHADLAHFVGATRQWVTISLKRFAERGIVETRRSGILIRQPAMLAKIRDGLDG